MAAKAARRQAPFNKSVLDAAESRCLHKYDHPSRQVALRSFAALSEFERELISEQTRAGSPQLAPAAAREEHLLK
jgi:hypothetical protein